jgi:hypothetical protein
VTLAYETYLMYQLVFTRMTGALLFNPSRGVERAGHRQDGARAALTVIIAPTQTGSAPSFPLRSPSCRPAQEMRWATRWGDREPVPRRIQDGGRVMDMEMHQREQRSRPAEHLSSPNRARSSTSCSAVFFASNGHLTLTGSWPRDVAIFPPGPQMSLRRWSEHRGDDGDIPSSRRSCEANWP